MIVNIYLMFDESLRDVFSALCKDIHKRLRGRGAELKDEELLLLKLTFLAETLLAWRERWVWMYYYLFGLFSGSYTVHVFLTFDLKYVQFQTVVSSSSIFVQHQGLFEA